jgi:hypothetical protein
MRLFVDATPWPLYPLERRGTHWIGGWVDPRVGLDVCRKSRPNRDTIHNIYNAFYFKKKN